jgi:large subunit ribosomal protein L14e
MFDVGRICMKVAGREAGRVCVVVSKEKDKEFVVVTGPKIVTKVRRRKCNVRHLEPTPVFIKIGENATDSEVMKAYEKDGIYKRLNLQKPTPEEIKLAEEAKARHREKPKEEKPKEEKKKEEKKPEKKEEEPRREHRKKKKHERPKKEKKHGKPKHRKEKKHAKKPVKKTKKKGKK